MGRHDIRNGDAGAEGFSQASREKLQVTGETRSAGWSIRNDDDRGSAGCGSHICRRGGDYVAAVHKRSRKWSRTTPLRGGRTSTAGGDSCGRLSPGEYEAL